MASVFELQESDDCSQFVRYDWPTGENNQMCSQRPLAVCQHPNCERALCVVHAEFCPKCGKDFCDAHIEIHQEGCRG
jgi:hypothetical protein